MLLQGKKIFLRPIVLTDASIMHKWENDKSIWRTSGTKKPFTKNEIKSFIENQKDIYLDKQLRLMISLSPAALLPDSSIQKKRRNGETEKRTIGCVDLFDFDSKKSGVGILIDRKYRKKGYASDALLLLIKYSFDILNLRELHCSISEENEASMKLFQKHKFKVVKKANKVHFLELLNK